MLPKISFSLIPLYAGFLTGIISFDTPYGRIKNELAFGEPFDCEMVHHEIERYQHQEQVKRDRECWERVQSGKNVRDSDYEGACNYASHELS